MIRRRFDVRISRLRRFAAVMLLAVAALVLGPVSASAVDIVAGFEHIQTVAGTETDLPAIPAGFFGVGCDAVAAGTTVALIGDPVTAGVPGDPDTTWDWPPSCHTNGSMFLKHCVDSLLSGESSSCVAAAA